MSLTIYHHGRLMTDEQKAVYSNLLTNEAFQKMGLVKQLAALDKALAEAGVPIAPLKPNDHVTWKYKGNVDDGQIQSIDQRAQKARVHSRKLRRYITVPLSAIKVEDV